MKNLREKPMSEFRCGRCKNCLDLQKVKKRVLACANPPFSHADDDVVDVWNAELERLKCLKAGTSP